MAKWKWKAGDGSSSGLLYEPGNWGDILKNEWLLQLLRSIRQKNNSQPLTLLDPFAGQPVYPLADNPATRVASMPELLLYSNMRVFMEQKLWPCASLLALEYCDSNLQADVYDQDENRYKQLAREKAFHTLKGNCGWELLRAAERNYSLVLIDPYDILQNWRQWLPAILDTAQHSPVLVYVYNRSGRSKERLRDYRAFCSEVKKSGQGQCLGRVAADAFLPDCWHEMLLLGGRSFFEAGELDMLRDRLLDCTQIINRAIQTKAMFEEL